MAITANSRQVTCVIVDYQASPWGRIVQIGGPNWTRTQEQAIAEIRADPNRYYVSANGSSVNVIIRQRDGRDYLTTNPDGKLPDNLRSLPRC